MNSLRENLNAKTAIVVCLVALAPVQVHAQEALPADLKVGDVVITAEQIDALLVGRPRSFAQLDPAEARRVASETLIAETVLQIQASLPNVRVSEQIGLAVADVRRQVLFEAFAQQEFDPNKPTPQEISAYVADNPHAFSERVIYRYQRAVLNGAERLLPASVRGALDQITSSPALSEADVAELFQAVVASDLLLSRDIFWNGSEIVPDELRSRLAQMRATGQSVDIDDDGEVVDVVFLFGAEANPVDPQSVQEQIEARILSARYAQHKRELAAQIAAPYLQAGAVDVRPEDGIFVGQLVAPEPKWYQTREGLMSILGIVGFVAALIVALGAFWLRVAFAFRNENDGQLVFIHGRNMSSNRVGFALVWLAVLVPLTLGSYVYGAWTVRAVLELQAIIVVAVGVGVVALVLGWSMWRAAESSEDFGYRRLGYQLALTVLIYFLAALGVGSLI